MLGHGSDLRARFYFVILSESSILEDSKNHSFGYQIKKGEVEHRNKRRSEGV
jgi:hypothetical protein